ncbi:MAG: hypothetical protein AMJ58_12440 [Gammaproteobacteria bacterium SG8_30]|nr:MAG: hypothetical protein AMJ58_12440 [Gammaproteobacteria bacterium SG8_30]
MVSGLTLAALAAPLVPAGAQQATLEEITVTATRRTESLQDVATSATVFSGDDLAALEVAEPRDLAEQTPGLLTKFGPNGLATVGFYMRGVGINDFTGTVDPSVGVYVDEVFMPTPDMLNFSVFDIQRVEVLRGPQGTLYGRNSTGGAINFITARPTESFEGYVRAGYGSYETATITGALSGPLSETLSGRVSVNAVNSSSSSGYSYNRFTDNVLGKVDSLALRGQLQWDPTDALSVRLMYGYGDSESEQPLLQHVPTRDPDNVALICDPVIEGRVDLTGACIDFLGYYDDDGDVYDGAANVDPGLKLRSDDVTLTIDWQGPAFTLTSISGYNDFSKRQSQDIDASPNVVADNFTFNDVQNFSQEVRLTSGDSARLPWIIGANYAKTDIDWFQTIDLSDLAIPTSNGAVQSTEAWAIFGQLTIPITDTLEFTGGLRYTDETREWTGATFVGTFATLDEAYASGAPRLSQLPLPPGDPGAGGPLDFPTKLSKDKVDYSAVLKYRPTDNAMFYLSVSELAGSARAVRTGGTHRLRDRHQAFPRRQRRATERQCLLLRLQGLPGDFRARHRGQRQAAERRRRGDHRARGNARLGADGAARPERRDQPAGQRDRSYRRRPAASGREPGDHDQGQRDPECSAGFLQWADHLQRADRHELRPGSADGFQLCRRTLSRTQQPRVPVGGRLLPDQRPRDLHAERRAVAGFGMGEKPG